MFLVLPPNVEELAVEHEMAHRRHRRQHRHSDRPGVSGEEDAIQIQRAGNHHGPRNPMNAQWVVPTTRSAENCGGTKRVKMVVWWCPEHR